MFIDEPLVVRRNGRAVRIAEMHIDTDGVFVPGSGDLRDCAVSSSVAAIIITAVACIIFAVVLVNQIDWWEPTQCDYSECRISASSIEDPYVTVEIMLTRGATKMPSKIRTLAAKAPYICQMTTGDCYATCDGNNRIYGEPTLSLEKIYSIPTSVIGILIFLSIPVNYALIYLFLVGSCYGYAMARAIHAPLAIVPIKTAPVIITAKTDQATQAPLLAAPCLNAEPAK